MKILNLYAGLGGNSFLWNKGAGKEREQVTAVEIDKGLCEIYQRLHPHHTVVCGDAHEYLLRNFHHFDFIWSSFPCQTHSQLNLVRKPQFIKYPDFKLYEEVVLLETYFKLKKPYIVENVIPFYKPLIKGQTVGRHLVWSNRWLQGVNFKAPPVHKDTNEVCKFYIKWLGLPLKLAELEAIEGKRKIQILRNTIHPQFGRALLDEALKGNKYSR